MPIPLRFTLTDISRKRPRFLVAGHFADGQSHHVGQIEYRWFAHLERHGWVATADDGSHRAVHQERWEAAWACGWDGAGIYPFPVHPRHRATVEGHNA